MVLCGRNILNGDRYGCSRANPFGVIGHWRPPVSDFGDDSGLFTSNMDNVVSRMDTVRGDGSIRPVLVYAIEDKGEFK
jgi:hypothetical protein